MNTPEIGSHIKVFIPGESPWAIVVATEDDGRVAARFDNHLVASDMGLHGYKYGDVATFERTGEYQNWELAPLERQLPSLG